MLVACSVTSMTTIAECEAGHPSIPWRTPVTFGGLRYGCRICLATHGPDCPGAHAASRSDWLAHMAREHGMRLYRPPAKGNEHEAWELAGTPLGPAWTAPGLRTEQP